MKVSYSTISQRIYIAKRRIVMPAIKRGMESSSYTKLIPKDIKNAAKTLKTSTEGHLAHCPKWLQKTLKTSGKLYLGKVQAYFLVLCSTHTGLPPDYLINGAKTLSNVLKTFKTFVKTYR